MARQRGVVTTQPFYWKSSAGTRQAVQLRLRGDWLADLFEPYTPLRVTRELRDGKVCLVLTTIQDERRSNESSGGTDFLFPVPCNVAVRSQAEGEGR